MEQAGIILIVSITVFLISLLAYSAKQRKQAESYSVPEKAPETKIPPVAPPVKTAETAPEKKTVTQQKPVQQYVSIYRWKIPQEKRICAHCDAENWPHALVCEVCNEKL